VFTIQQSSPRPAAWHRRSRCRSEDPDLFFPTGSSAATQRQAERAKQVCRRCAVREPCLAWALEHDLPGVWGATDDSDRQSLQRAAGA
jgi:WhiB family redox-sensing transcriptional regulator